MPNPTPHVILNPAASTGKHLRNRKAGHLTLTTKNTERSKETQAARGRGRRPAGRHALDRHRHREMAGLDVLTYLSACLDACGRNSGKHPAGPELDRFTLESQSPEDRHDSGVTACSEPTPPVTCLPTGLPNTYCSWIS